MDKKENAKSLESDVIAENTEFEQLTEDEEKAVDEAADNIKKDIMTQEGVWKIRLSNPVTYDGETIETVEFEFKKLTGMDGFNIESELEAKGKNAFMNESVNTYYLLAMAARACKRRINIDFFNLISLYDFNRIKAHARYFLLTGAA